MDILFEYGSYELAPGLVETQPGVAISYIVILAVFAIVGTMGNILIIGAIMTGPNKIVTGNFFVINLTIADLIVTSLINPIAILGVVKGESFFDGAYWACRMLASICVVACFSSLLNIGAISINRYIFLVHNEWYDKVYSRFNTVLLCLLNWILAYMVDMPSHIGWSEHIFDKKSKKCLWDRPKNWYYTVYVIMVGIMLPLITTTCFYLLIFLHISAVKKRVVASGTNSNKSSLKSSIRQAKMMCVIFVCFTACWLPYVIVLFADRHDTFPIWAHLFGSLTAHLHASINFFIYGSCNRKIRTEYERFFYGCIQSCRKRNAVGPQESARGRIHVIGSGQVTNKTSL